MDDSRYIDRRTHMRFDVRVPVRISTIDPELDPRTGRKYFRSSRVWSVNLSRGGLFVHTADPVEPGRRLLVEVDLPGGDTIEAVGKVAWSRRILGTAESEDGIGVKFIGATAEQMLALESYLFGGNAAKAAEDAGSAASG